MDKVSKVEVKSRMVNAGEMELTFPDGERVTIKKDAFSSSDWDALAWQGILIKVQRTVAGAPGDWMKALELKKKKARELARGQLNSAPGRVDVQAIEKSVILKAAASMAAAGVPADVIVATFPTLSRTELEQMTKAVAGKPSKAK